MDIKVLCWCKCLTGKVSKMNFAFIRLKLLSAAFIGQQAVTMMIILFLLAGTELGCNYVQFYQTYLSTASLVVQIFWQFISAVITDKTDKIAHWVLLITVVLETGLDAAMFFWDQNPWALTVMFIARFSLLQQAGNSAGKLLKMRLQLVLQWPQDIQLEAYNNLTVHSDFIGRTTIVLGVYTVVMVLSKTSGISFQWVKNLFFIAMAFWDLVSIIILLTIRKHFYVPPDADVPPERRLLLEDAAADEPPQVLTPDDEYLSDPSLQEMPAFKRFFVFFGRCFRVFWRNKLLLCANIHFWLFVVIFAFVTIVLRFDVPTTENFCSGTMLVLIEQQLYNEISRLVGNVFYQLVLGNVTPLHFYSRWFVLFGLILGGSTALIFFNSKLSSTVSSLNLAAINIVVCMSNIMDANIAAAVVSPHMVGFLFGVQGSVGQLLGLVPIGFQALVANKEVILSVYAAVIAVSVVFALFFGIRYRKNLRLLAQAAMGVGSDNNSGCFHRFIFGW